MISLFDETMKAPFGVVDMGSNGIRFGIVTALTRHLPVIYEERAPISLLEAQGEDHCIPKEIIEQVIASFLRFKTICRHEGVNQANVKVIATEATRVALNSEEFLERIYSATQWKVTILTKEQEAVISSMGIVGKLRKYLFFNQPHSSLTIPLSSRVILHCQWLNYGFRGWICRIELCNINA